MSKFDPSRLLAQLQNTGLAIKDNPLFQLLFQMLNAMAAINSEVNGFTASGGSSGGTTNITQIIQQLSLDSGSGGDSSGSDISIPGARGADGVNGMVPYYIATAEVFTVPIYKQALFSMNIDNNGSLVVDGFLIEVD